VIGSFMFSMVYAIMTQPTMKSIAMPVFKGTLMGLVGAIAYYRYKQHTFNNELGSYYNTILDRVSKR
jgi:hypothetical protein